MVWKDSNELFGQPNRKQIQFKKKKKIQWQNRQKPWLVDSWKKEGLGWNKSVKEFLPLMGTSKMQMKHQNSTSTHGLPKSQK